MFPAQIFTVKIYKQQKTYKANQKQKPEHGSQVSYSLNILQKKYVKGLIILCMMAWKGYRNLHRKRVSFCQKLTMSFLMVNWQFTHSLNNKRTYHLVRDGLIKVHKSIKRESVILSETDHVVFDGELTVFSTGAWKLLLKHAGMFSTETDAQQMSQKKTWCFLTFHTDFFKKLFPQCFIQVMCKVTENLQAVTGTPVFQ